MPACAQNYHEPLCPPISHEKGERNYHTLFVNESPQREAELFDDVAALPAAERAAYLDRAIGADAVLRRRLNELLLAHDGVGELDDAPPALQVEIEAARGSAPHDDAVVGLRIGRYKVLERIGEGGCGTVYMAEQEEPVRRRVALKVIKVGMDTKAVIARFEAERQALALMDHPNIARVFDGGATETGRPYFVMELVKGVPITHYSDQAKLSTADRLKLFVKVCDAVQHAHQKGIIHRDLKPSNILVARNDGVAVPKVIDFGIAKATTDLRLTDKTLFTRFNDFIGTPVYMSPEQAVMTNVDVDTRSDIYSLGVLLYELLTAQLPFDRATLERVGVDEARRMLREVDPPRPSQRVNTLSMAERTSVAQCRGIGPVKLTLLLRTDLDWIVLRCLEKDRARRYETVNGLAKDIQRYLDEEPVLARPPSAGYRLRKLIRRNRLAVAAGSVVFLALTLGFSISMWQAIRATRAEREEIQLREQAVREREQAIRERELANAARAHAEGLLGYLLEDFFTELQPIGRVEMVGGFAHRLISYYDNLPAGLQNEDTERNRALAQLREGGAFIRGGQPAKGAEVLHTAQDFFAQRHEARKDDESAALDLAMALGWQFAFGHLAVNTQIPWERTVEQFRRACDLARPYATRPHASVRARRIYAMALSEFGSWIGNTDEGVRTCEEARAMLRDLGATDGTDWTLTSCYSNASDSEAQYCVLRGKLDEAEQLENECCDLLDRMLVKRPGNLEAMAAQWGRYWTLSDIAARRFHLTRATELAEEAVKAANEYAKIDKGAAGAFVGPWFTRLALSDLYWKLGRVRDSMEMSYAVLTQMDTFEVERDWTLPEKSYWYWMNNMYRELERGNQAAADRGVIEFARKADKLRELKCGWEPYLAEYTATAQRFADYHYPRDHGRAWADSLADLQRLAALTRTGSFEKLSQGLQIRALWVASGNGGLAGRDAEVEALVRRETKELQTGDFTLDQNQLEPRLWLARALARQHKSVECAEELKPLLAFFRHIWDEGDRSIDTSRGWGFALYVQAINEPDDADGRLRRRAALAEAAKLLDALSDEAKQLVSWRMVIDWVAAERARQP